MDIDANPFPTEDPILMLRKVTMAFMLTLSKQPNMLLEFSEGVMQNFPYECFRLTASIDEDSGTVTFMLVPEENCEVKH